MRVLLASCCLSCIIHLVVLVAMKLVVVCLRLNLDIYYSEIVHCLMVASHTHIPRIPCSSLKHYWSSALDDLKQDCIQAHNVWDFAYRPRSDSTFVLRKMVSIDIN